MSNKKNESLLRSVQKTATWYVSDFVLTFIISFIITREIKTSAAIGLAQQTWELILYFAHERVWARVHRKIKSE